VAGLRLLHPRVRALLLLRAGMYLCLYKYIDIDRYIDRYVHSRVRAKLLLRAGYLHMSKYRYLYIYIYIDKHTYIYIYIYI